MPSTKTKKMELVSSDPYASKFEEAEVLASEGKIEGAIERLAATLARFENEIQEPSLIAVHDEIQTRRAYFLTDLDQFEKAIPILEEVTSRRNDDTIFLFYLGHSYFRAKRWSEAQQKLERALALGPRPRIAFQAHGSLGMVFYETGDYQRAKEELEASAKLAAPDYIKQAHIWKLARIHVCKPRAERGSTAVRSTSPTILREGPD